MASVEPTPEIERSVIDSPTACSEYLVELAAAREQLDDEWRSGTAWMLRYMVLHNIKSIEVGDRVIRLKKMAPGCESCEQKKRESTQFWHPGADGEFLYVAVEKKKS